MNLKKIIDRLQSQRGLFLLGFVVLLSGFMHGYNMFHYPYFENDEATYMAQAWSFLSQGKLAPYTYWYDHAPFGWIFSSIWIFLTGGLFAFGFSLNSARVFMLVLHIISTILLYRISKKITGTNLSAFLTCLFFAVSPLAIYFQRRFLLDNIMTFWLLVALYLILYSKDRLLLYFASALSFGAAVLSKENAIFFMPAFLSLVATGAHIHHKTVAVIKWAVVAGMVISLYPLYALLKKELFPAGSIFSSSSEHVSLLGTLLFQSSRGSNLPFWNLNSDFITNLMYWFGRDQFFISLGFISFFAVTFQAISNKVSRTVFLLTFSMLAFLASGKLVINFYIIPLVPFLALCIGYIIDQQFKQVKRFNKYLYIPLILIFLSIFSYQYYHSNNLKIALLNDETTNQIKAMEWVKKNVEPDKFIAIDYYGNLDFTHSRFLGDPIFKNADWFWKVQFDPEIKENKLKGNSKNIDYILLTAEMYRSITGIPNNESLIVEALKNSSLVKFFSDDPETEFSLPSYPKSHPNGNWVAIYKQSNLDTNLALSWQTYKNKFLTTSGKTLNETSSEVSGAAQSTMLLRSALVSDQKTFDLVLDWTQKNMVSENKNLLVTSIDTEDITSTNSGTTTENDQNFALSQLIAYRNWGDQKYLSGALKTIEDIWENETAIVNGKRYIVAGDWTAGKNLDKYTINTSYFSPVTYRIFGKYDKKNNWSQIVDSSYELLNSCSSSKLGATDGIFLPPSWCDIEKDGTIVASKNIGKESSNYTQETAKIFMNLGMDYSINKEARVLKYFKQIELFTTEWKKNKVIVSSYTHSGVKAADNESVTHYASLMPYFNLTNRDIALQIYNDKIAPKAVIDKKGFTWGDSDNNAEQYTAWLGVLVYLDKIPDSLSQ